VSEQPWDVQLTAPARRQLDRLPNSVAAVVVETLGAIAGNPRRLGKPLRFELEACWSVRRGPYRIVYWIDDEARTVLVVAVAHRADAYRSR